MLRGSLKAPKIKGFGCGNNNIDARPQIAINLVFFHNVIQESTAIGSPCPKVLLFPLFSGDLHCLKHLDTFGVAIVYL